MTSEADSSNSVGTSFYDRIFDRKRGRLKIYLGMSAGVGKTYKMLTEAHDLLKRGVDVKIGLAVTHGRAETERLATGLPTIPLKQVFYKGQIIEEIDLMAILNSGSEVVIIDELAHSNVPGLMHEKRWQDVLFLLSQGINVITAVNVQHLESLNVVVEQITGIKVTETIPDQVIQMADEVITVDIAAEELIQRLKAGKIYKPEQAKAALENFFQENTLLQLRELALKKVTGQLEQKLEQQLQNQHFAAQRICLCISTNEQAAKRMIRKVARLFQPQTNHWYVLYIQTEKESTHKIPLNKQRHLLNNFKLASELGAEVITIKHKNIAEAIVNFSLENHISLIIVGKSHKKWWQSIFRGSIITQLITSTHTLELDILLIN